MARPLRAIVLSTVALLLLAAPTLDLETASGGLRQFDSGDDTRVGMELLTAEVGAGAAGPIQIVTSLHEGTVRDGANAAGLDAYVRALRRDLGVARVGPPQPSRDGRSALITVVPRSGIENRETIDLVERLRDGAGQPAALRAATVRVGGATAQNEDFHELVTGSMLKLMLFVMALTYVVLLIQLRSVLLPLKAILTTALTVGAAYGAIVAVFQWGITDGIMGYESLGYVNTVTLPFILPIVFGLSMDYEVFLLSRIKERYEATGDNRRAVAEGLRASAATITSAALIMVSVFLVFVAVSIPSIKEFGLGLAVAIALDATLIRLILVPATMEVLGRWNWWLPAWMERLLPGGTRDVTAPERVVEPSA